LLRTTAVFYSRARRLLCFRQPPFLPEPKLCPVGPAPVPPEPKLHWMRRAVRSVVAPKDFASLDICPLHCDPKASPARTCHSPVCVPKATDGSNDSTRSSSRPKSLWKILRLQPSVSRAEAPLPPNEPSVAPESEDPFTSFSPAFTTEARRLRCLQRAIHPFRRDRNHDEPDELLILFGTEVPLTRAPPLDSPQAEAFVEPNERLRWPQELPRLQGVNPRSDPPHMCRWVRPAHSA
jgi:hypothetical protein